MVVSARQVYRSRVDRWLLGLSVGVVLLASVPNVVLLWMPETRRVAFLALALNLGVLAFMRWIFTSTLYILEGETLVVQSGPLRWHVPLATLRAVTPTRNPLSAPALSLERLELQYGDGQTLLISPLEQDEFLDDLVRRSPGLVREGNQVMRHKE